MTSTALHRQPEKDLMVQLNKRMCWPFVSVYNYYHPLVDRFLKKYLPDEKKRDESIELIFFKFLRYQIEKTDTLETIQYKVLKYTLAHAEDLLKLTEIRALEKDIELFKQIMDAIATLPGHSDYFRKLLTAYLLFLSLDRITEEHCSTVTKRKLFKSSNQSIKHLLSNLKKNKKEEALAFFHSFYDELMQRAYSHLGKDFFEPKKRANKK